MRIAPALEVGPIHTIDEVVEGNEEQIKTSNALGNQSAAQMAGSRVAGALSILRCETQLLAHAHVLQLCTTCAV